MNYEKPTWQPLDGIRSLRDFVLEIVMEPMERAYDKQLNGDDDDPTVYKL